MVGQPFGDQLPVDRHLATRGQFHDGSRVEGEHGVDLERQAPVDDVGQVGAPGAVDIDAATHAYAVRPVPLGDVAAEAGPSPTLHVDGVAAVADQRVASHLWRRSGADPQAVAAILPDDVALDRGRRGVEELQAVAVAGLDEAPQYLRTGAIERDVRVRGARSVVVPSPAVAHNCVSQHRRGIGARVGEVDGAPIAGVGLGRRPVLVSILAELVVVNRGEDDGMGDRTARDEGATHDQVVPGEKLEDDPRL